MKRTSKRKLWQIGLLFLPLILISVQLSPSLKSWRIVHSARLFPDAENARPLRTDYETKLFQGLAYSRWVRSQPRPLVIHTISVDLSTPGISFLVTPSEPGVEVAARTTSAFLREFDVQVAINGSYFEPFWARTPWDFYPRSGDPVRVKGLAISGSTAYSQPLADWPTLCIAPAHVFIERTGCPPQTTHALAGNHLLVDKGQALRQVNAIRHPRTAVATTDDGATLWLIVVDGRQPNYSEGVTLAELADIVLELGASMALNLDGGGSSTMVVSGLRGPELLNAPIHTNVAMRQRPVANHLGIFAPSID